MALGSLLHPLLASSRQPQQQKQNTTATAAPASGPSGGASRPAPTVTVLTITDLYPDAPTTIGGWDEALLCLGFYFICAPVTWALVNAPILCCLGWYRAHRALWCLYFAYWGLLYLDLVPKPTRLNQACLRSWLLKAIVRYFDGRVIIEDHEDLKEARPTMTCQTPHSTYPIATLCGAFFGPHIFPPTKEGRPREGFCLVASSMQLLLGYWQYMQALGARPISAQAIKEIKEEGNVVNIVTGGIAEMFLCHEQEDRVLVRRGFIREALRNGIDIVPVYHFNHTQIFRYILPDVLNKPLATLCRKTGLPFVPFYGRFGFFVPFKVQLTSVVGRAIRTLEANPDPSPEEVERVVAEYKREVKRIYYTYRPADCARRELVLLDEFPW